MAKKIALVLAGGGALGAYEVGGYKALRELGFKFDIVTGTSIGAINGAFVCTDMMQDIEKLWLDISANKIMEGGLSISKDSLIKNKYGYSLADYTSQIGRYFGNRMSVDITPFKKLVKKYVDTKRIKESKIKFGIVTTVQQGMKPTFVCMNDISEDEMCPYLHASSACTPVFPPEEINGVKYIDGFFSDNVPMNLAFEYGADEVITLDMRLFSLNPKHMAYMKYHNVTYIAPYISLGSMLDFEQDPIRKNIARGYNDVMKHYGKYIGFVFTFKGELPSHRFFQAVLDEFGDSSDKALEFITSNLRLHHLSDDQLFARTMEIVALSLGINDDVPVYTYDEFINIIKTRLNLLKVKEGKGLLRKAFNAFNSMTLEKTIERRLIDFFIKRYIDSNLVPKGNLLLR